ncbi:hypothetical protein CN878_20620 [Ochrobactrum sp. 695/2009]|nr:hypothetical protein CN881_04950 [Ochrobactrum sp. 721/2009]PJT22145.1 hypothetical protein CN879_12690 [Ochrobactrum sp. 715/2009]PJT25166.1 hypothetical protein CN878_20620 [Ochrobactrum sp. 695/2009]
MHPMFSKCGELRAFTWRRDELKPGVAALLILRSCPGNFVSLPFLRKGARVSAYSKQANSC